MKLRYQVIIYAYMPLWLATILSTFSMENIAAEKEWYLARMATELLEESEIESDVEYAQYYSRNSTIKYKGDLVYGEEYGNLREEVENRRQYLTQAAQKVNSTQKVSFGQKKEYPNFMAVILCATGRKDNMGEPKRVFSSLCVREDKERKHIFNRGTSSSKIVIFCSNNFVGVLADDDKYTFLKLSNLNETQDQEIIEKVDGQSHTEPLGLAAVLTLSNDTFIKMLGKEYILMYYEIHLISYYDACTNCPAKIYNTNQSIKDHFLKKKDVQSRELFTFYHSNNSYDKEEKVPYALKFKAPHKHNKTWCYIKGTIPNFQYIWIKKADVEGKKYPSSYTLIGENDITEVINSYIAICYNLDRPETNPSYLRRIHPK